MPTRKRFKTSFVKKSEFLRNLFFVEKFRTKRGYFEKILSKVSILKRIPIFFGLKRIPIFWIKNNSYFFD